MVIMVIYFILETLMRICNMWKVLETFCKVSINIKERTIVMKVLVPLVLDFRLSIVYKIIKNHFEMKFVMCLLIVLRKHLITFALSTFLIVV